jgi:hypothetical protein
MPQHGEGLSRCEDPRTAGSLPAGDDTATPVGGSGFVGVDEPFLELHRDREANGNSFAVVENLTGGGQRIREVVLID